MQTNDSPASPPPNPPAGRGLPLIVIGGILLSITALFGFTVIAGSNTGHYSGPGKARQQRAYDKFAGGQRLNDSDVEDLANREVWVSPQEERAAGMHLFACVVVVLGLPGLIMLVFGITHSRQAYEANLTADQRHQREVARQQATASRAESLEILSERMRGGGRSLMQFVTALPSRVNGALRAIAGADNEIVFRFLQVLFVCLLLVGFVVLISAVWR